MRPYFAFDIDINSRSIDYVSFPLWCFGSRLSHSSLVILDQYGFVNDIYLPTPLDKDLFLRLILRQYYLLLILLLVSLLLSSPL